jgi:hypothetical protein
VIAAKDFMMRYRRLIEANVLQAVEDAEEPKSTAALKLNTFP